ncbi:hypothetical protein O6H91_21G005200 [Diphasiastrum complanatum]|uniref:Uncharacterized protein n=1 Tax=Diphasiastrum complanatum TaxID=34168 RepID=A0ACC2AHA2_DIPCM|nr:hypothetical protein O6H91_21G005200 [Diphasiastrum complanatum]
MATVGIPVVLLLMTMLAISIPSTMAAGFSVTNYCEKPINMTCASRNDNLGTSLLHVGESREWEFGGWAWTKFWCDFRKDAKQLHQDTWTWPLSFLREHKTHIKWLVKEAGIYMDHEIDPEEFFKGWN